jgi:hypothetical protein
VNVYESEREQTRIIRRQSCGARSVAAIFRGALEIKHDPALGMRQADLALSAVLVVARVEDGYRVNENLSHQRDDKRTCREESAPLMEGLAGAASRASKLMQGLAGAASRASKRRVWFDIARLRGHWHGFAACWRG